MTNIPRSLRLLFSLFVVQLLFLSAMRLAFWTYFHNPADPVPGGDLLQAFYLGLKYDVRLTLMVLLPPLVLGWLPWLRLFDARMGRKLWQGYFIVAFLVLLFLTSLTGLLLLVLRETPLMGTLLAVHLGVVLGLFLTLPYGKFVHAVYRYAALLRNSIEQKREAT